MFGKISDNVCTLIFTFNNMGIDKDIQQENFRSIYQKLSINLIFSTNWITEKIKNILQEEDITPQQYNILRILRGSKKPLSTLQIRERMLDKMSDTSRIVERLVKKELVEKKTSNIDKRLVERITLCISTMILSQLLLLQESLLRPLPYFSKVF